MKILDVIGPKPGLNFAPFIIEVDGTIDTPSRIEVGNYALKVDERASEHRLEYWVRYIVNDHIAYIPPNELVGREVTL